MVQIGNASHRADPAARKWPNAERINSSILTPNTRRRKDLLVTTLGGRPCLIKDVTKHNQPSRRNGPVCSNPITLSPPCRSSAVGDTYLYSRTGDPEFLAEVAGHGAVLSHRSACQSDLGRGHVGFAPAPSARAPSPQLGRLGSAQRSTPTRSQPGSRRSRTPVCRRRSWCRSPRPGR